MSLVLADRVFETSTTQGTGTLNLAGAPTKFQTFVSGVGDGAVVPYFIDDNVDWEVGIGTVTAGSPDTLSRDTILASSNSGAAVFWNSDQINVRLFPAAMLTPTLRSANVWTEANTFQKALTLQGPLQLEDDGELTISSGSITVTGSNHTIDTESDAASDDLDTISGGADGQIVTLRANNEGRTVVFKHGTGNIKTAYGGDITLDETEKTVVLIYDDALSSWVVLAAPGVNPQDYYDTGEIDTKFDDLGFTQVVESGLLVMTSGTSITFAHGLGVIPENVVLEIECQTAEFGYSVGDVLEISHQASDVGTGCTIEKDATNVIVRIGSANIGVANQSAGNATATITGANWRMRIKARG